MKKVIKNFLLLVVVFSGFLFNITQADEVTPLSPDCILPQILVDGVCADPVPTPTTPIITWSNPADIIEGTALSTLQLNAVSSVPGNFVYTPNEGTILAVGTNQTLSVTFTPTDTVSYTTATASTTINVNPNTSGGGATLNINVTVDVPKNCSTTDIDGIIHDYPEDSSSSSYLAICALEAAISNGSISGVKLSNQYPSLGLFVTEINGIAANPSSQYWAIYQNGNYAMSGITLMHVIAGDIITFQLQGFYDPNNLNNLDNQATINIRSLKSNTNSGGGYVSKTVIDTPKTKPVFDIKKAFEYLISQQKEDGSFGDLPALPDGREQAGDLYTDWTALVLATNSDYSNQKNKLIKYESGVNTIDFQLTDFERHTMALMALGLNPYDVKGQNYIKKITDTFDGKQFGDPEKDNDDIFALIVLQNAGYPKNDAMIKQDINFVLSKQKTDGSWDESVDLTGAGIEALASLDPLLPNLEKAKQYLKQNQKDEGGFGNVSSTAWALGGILALNEKPTDWKVDENSPLDYLAINQDTDGGIKADDTNSKIWETAYVLSSLSGKTWNQIMQKFEQPIPKKQIPISELKSQIKKITKIKDLKKIASGNNLTASPINAITSNPKTEPSKNQSWFRRLLNKIFGL